MYLQLAEGGNRPQGNRPHRKPHRPLQSNGNTRTRISTQASRSTQDDNPYIFIPNFETGGGVFVREDKFDAMPNDQWQIFIKTLAPFQPQVQQGLHEDMFLATRAERKQRREDRHQKHLAKIAIKNAKAAAKAEGRGAGIFGNILDTAKDIFGKKDSTDNSGAPAPGGAPDDGTPKPKKKSNTGTYILIGGVAVTLLVGGLAWNASKKKKAQAQL